MLQYKKRVRKENFLWEEEVAEHHTEEAVIREDTPLAEEVLAEVPEAEEVQDQEDTVLIIPVHQDIQVITHGHTGDITEVLYLETDVSVQYLHL